MINIEQQKEREERAHSYFLVALPLELLQLAAAHFSSGEGSDKKAKALPTWHSWHLDAERKMRHKNGRENGLMFHQQLSCGDSELQREEG